MHQRRRFPEMDRLIRAEFEHKKYAREKQQELENAADRMS